MDMNEIEKIALDKKCKKLYDKIRDVFQLSPTDAAIFFGSIVVPIKNQDCVLFYTTFRLFSASFDEIKYIDIIEREIIEATTKGVEKIDQKGKEVSKSVVEGVFSKIKFVVKKNEGSFFNIIDDICELVCPAIFLVFKTFDDEFANEETTDVKEIKKKTNKKPINIKMNGKGTGKKFERYNNKENEEHIEK